MWLWLFDVFMLRLILHLKSVGFLSNSVILTADMAEIRSFHFHARGKKLVYKDELFPQN